MLQKDHRLPSSCFALNIVQRSKVNTQACLLEILQKKKKKKKKKKTMEINNPMSRRQLN
ncbi:hypothetical protein LEMLEM_LOCUS5336 [Lemmus lemmus]